MFTIAWLLLALYIAASVGMPTDVLDAARDVDPNATLLVACLAAAAQTPTYQIRFREYQRDVCIHRPWRTGSWRMVPQPCPCE